MKLHEYQAKELFAKHGVPVPEGIVALTAGDALAAAEALGYPVAIKAQVHIGGRGKAGGVKLVSDGKEAEAVAEAILGLTIGGFPVRKLLVTPAVDVAHELYLSLLIDRNKRTAVYIGCAEGGVEIETVAKESPEKILRCEVNARELDNAPERDLTAFVEALCLEAGHVPEVVDVMAKIGKCFKATGASLIEINPLIVDTSGAVIALDAKMVLDDNALFQHPELAELRDIASEDEDELEADKAGVSFVRLEGSIGCVVNGAGLAMATMDVIKHLGGAPSNFLDIGGGARSEKVVTAFKMILKDPNVKVILVNILGGITRCDEVAKGILAALADFDVPVPIVIRLAGTNEAEGRALLEGTQLIFAETLEQGAETAIKIGGAA